MTIEHSAKMFNERGSRLLNTYARQNADFIPDEIKSKIFQYFSYASSLGDKNAYPRLAECYLKGFGTPKDMNQAKSLLCEYADYKKDKEAYLHAANACLANDDLNDAFGYFRSAGYSADKAGAKIINHLFFDPGLSDKDALNMLESVDSSLARCPDIRFKTGYMYICGYGTSDVSARTYHKGLEILKEQADRSHQHSNYFLGHLYLMNCHLLKAADLFGNLTNDHKKHARFSRQIKISQDSDYDTDLALLYFKKAAFSGHTKSDFLIAYICDNPEYMVPCADTAIRHYERFLQKPDTNNVDKLSAYQSLADLYHHRGTAQALQKEYIFLQKAADMGDDEAFYFLGCHDYKNKNYASSRQHFLKAALGSSQEARLALKELHFPMHTSRKSRPEKQRISSNPTPLTLV